MKMFARASGGGNKKVKKKGRVEDVRSVKNVVEGEERARMPGAVAGCVREIRKEFPGVEINTDGAGRIV